MVRKINLLVFSALRRSVNWIFNHLGRRRRLNRNWPTACIHDEVIIEGDKRSLSLGKGTIIEPGVRLSTKHGGQINIGENCVVRRGAILSAHGGDITIGDHCGVNPYTILYGHGGLSVGNYVWFAAHCVVIPASHTYGRLDLPIYEQPLTKRGIVIEDDVWIGANVTILDGVSIGRGAVIGAGAVVTREVVPFSINVGVPARMIGLRKKK